MKTSRRSFLASATAAAGLVPFSGFPAVVSRRSPNSVLSHACVGTGNMAFADFNGLRSHPDIHITALCDVDANYLAKAKKICPDARVYRNAHEMMEKEGDRIDSVNVSTPDHSHAGYVLDALARGVPNVSLVGELLVQRFPFAAYRTMGVEPAPLARTREEYVANAVRLGREPDYRRALVDEIVKRRTLVFEREQAVAEFSDFMSQVIESVRSL